MIFNKCDEFIRKILVLKYPRVLGLMFFLFFNCVEVTISTLKIFVNLARVLIKAIPTVFGGNCS